MDNRIFDGYARYRKICRLSTWQAQPHRQDFLEEDYRGLKGEYKGSASAEGYTLKDGTALNLSDKDQKWLGLKDTFKF